MALSILKLIYLVLTMAAGGALIWLYIDKSERLSFPLILNLGLAFLFSWINYSSYAENQVLRRGISWIWALLALIGFLVKLVKGKKDSAMLSKVLISLALVGGVVQMILV